MYGYIVFTAILATILGLSPRWLRAPDLPTINVYPGDFTKKKAREEFLSNAQVLLAEGARKVGAYLSKQELVADCSTPSSMALSASLLRQGLVSSYLNPGPHSSRAARSWIISRLFVR